MLGRGWGSPTDWSGINPRNNRKDHPDQAEDASCSGLTKSYADRNRNPMEFEVGDRVMLKAGKLPKEAWQSSPYFPTVVSNLKKCYAVDDKL
ncbi:hypothetical protein Tco_0478351 [Tanacetum coccineum]